MHQSHNAAFGAGRGGGWEKPSLGLGNTSGLLAVAAAVLQGKTAAPGTNFSPYIERPSIQESPPSSRTGRSQGHNRRGKFSFPVTQSSSHSGIFSANATQVKAAVADGKAQGAFPHGPVTRSAPPEQRGGGGGQKPAPPFTHLSWSVAMFFLLFLCGACMGRSEVDVRCSLSLTLSEARSLMELID